MNHEEPEAIAVCLVCKEAMPFSHAVIGIGGYYHTGCYARYEKAMDNARDYQQTIADYCREKDGE
jgi:hypothetical protein